jgi:hypothetical protein
VVIVSYSRGKLWLQSAVGALFGASLLYYTLPSLLHNADELRSAAGRLLLIFPGVGIGLLGYGIALAVRASKALPALEADASGLAITTLFGTTRIGWSDFAGAAFCRHPKSRQPQLVVTYRSGEAVTRQTLHLSLTDEPGYGFERIADQLAEAQRTALQRAGEPMAQQRTVASPVPGFGRKRA